jgi:hypothetical protein
MIMIDWRQQVSFGKIRRTVSRYFWLDFQLLGPYNSPFNIVQREFELGKKKINGIFRSEVANGTCLKFLYARNIHNDTHVSVIGSPGLLEYSGDLATIYYHSEYHFRHKSVHHQGESSPNGL